MPLHLDATLRTAGPEIDNVIEREAGLRSVREAARILGIETAAIMAALEGAGMPNAFRTVEGHWRIPLEDIRHFEAHHRESGRWDSPPAAVLMRRRYPYAAPPQQPARWMIPAERRNRIVELLEVQRSLRVSALSARFGVSQMTIRRDLTQLEAEGRLTRTHGGATANRCGLELVPGSATRPEAGARG